MSTPMLRPFRTLALLSAVWLMSEAPAYAECVFQAKQWMESALYEIVFEGSAQALQTVEGPLANIVTMEVHRVWKGTLPAQMELYASASTAHPQLQLGRPYVLAIQRMRPSDVPQGRPDLVYRTMPCAGEERDALERMGVLDAFGPGRPPGH